MRITIVAPSLECGGTERVASLLANQWSRRGEAVTLITLMESSDPHGFFALDPEVTVVALNCVPVRQHLLSRLVSIVPKLVALRAAIQRSAPDVVISFLNWVNLLTVVSLIGARSVPIIASERSDTARGAVTIPVRWLTRLAYERVQALVVVLSRELRCYSERVQAKGVFIPNPAPAVTRKAAPGEPAVDSKRYRLLSIGRLSKEKGFDLLIEAFSILSSRHPEWDLWILGEGAERGALEGLRERLGVYERVFLPGRVANPDDYMVDSHLFALPSRYEGFPNVLVEAMAHGLPVVAYEDVGACPDILRHHYDGIVVTPPHSVPALAAALDRLMGSPKERMAIGGSAQEVVERFSLESVLAIWSSLIQRVRNGEDPARRADGAAR